MKGIRGWQVACNLQHLTQGETEITGRLKATALGGRWLIRDVQTDHESMDRLGQTACLLTDRPSDRLIGENVVM